MNVLKLKVFISSNTLTSFQVHHPKIQISSFFDHLFVSADSLRAGHKKWMNNQLVLTDGKACVHIHTSGLLSGEGSHLS